MQSITHSQAVHNRCQHAHMVADHTVHARFCQPGATEQVTATNDYTHLNAQLDQLFDFLGHTVQYAGIDTEAFCTLQSFAAQF